MDRATMNQKHTKSSKHFKKKPLKVVYISNPMKFVASPDEFRAVVQQLTGRQSNIVDMAEATGFLTAGIAEIGSTNIVNTSIDQTRQLACRPGAIASLDDHLYEGYTTDQSDMFGDLSSICYESLIRY